MKGAKGWIHTPLIWYQPHRPRWLLPTDTIIRVMNMFPKCPFHSTEKEWEPPPQGTTFLRFPTRMTSILQPLITSPLMRENKECIYTRNKGSRTWEICAVNWSPMICEKYICFVKQCVSHSSWEILPIILLSYLVFFSKEFISTTSFVTNFTMNRRGKVFRKEKCSGLSY